MNKGITFDFEFWVLGVLFVLCVGEPDIIDAVIQFIQAQARCS